MSFLRANNGIGLPDRLPFQGAFSSSHATHPQGDIASPSVLQDCRLPLDGCTDRQNDPLFRIEERGVWEGHVLTRDYPFLDLLTFQALRDWYGGAADEIGYCGGYGYPTFAIQLAADNSLAKKPNAS